MTTRAPIVRSIPVLLKCVRSHTVLASAPQRVTPALDAPQHGDQRIDLLAGVVERQRSTHGAFLSEPAQDRLGAVMARTHRDALAVERRPISSERNP
jgi:hypothetical protein